MNKNKINLSIIIIISVVVLVAAGTYAYWAWQSDASNKTNIALTVTADFSCSATGGGNITNANIAPAACTNSTYSLQRTITTTINNTGTEPVGLDLWLKINSIGSGIAASNNFKWALTTDSTSCTSNIVSSGTFKGYAANDIVYLLNNVSSGSTYYLYIWLDPAEENDSTMNQSYSMSLGGKCAQTSPVSIETKLASMSTTDENVVDFSKTSVDNNTNGLYTFHSTASDTHPVYYYRGNVTNNNAIFANYCWKIVRTTSTGGTKLIYNGRPVAGKCTTTTGTKSQIKTSSFNVRPASESGNTKYLGYMYDDSGTQTNSTIKTAVDNWYQGNMTSYTSKIEDTVWCNDRSIASESGNNKYYGAYNRLTSTYSPIVTCPQKDDAFTVDDTTNGNGLLTYPVGLLTADEVMLAGGKQGNTNNMYYLYTNQSCWLSSPFRRTGTSTYMISVNLEGTLNYQGINSAYGVRPSISLKSTMKFSEGDGTANNPYIVVE